MNKISPDFIGDNPEEMKVGTITPEINRTTELKKGCGKELVYQRNRVKNKIKEIQEQLNKEVKK